MDKFLVELKEMDKKASYLPMILENRSLLNLEWIQNPEKIMLNFSNLLISQGQLELQELLKEN